MKNIFKKNQIIITALAIMIAIAGYLNLSDRNNKAALETNGDVLDYDTSEETMGDDITQSDVFSDEALLDETGLDLSKEDDKKSDETAKDELPTVSVSDTGEITKPEEKDKEEDKKEDNKKEEKETSAPGEAVLVSTTTTADFFASSRLSREQTRAMNKENIMKIINSENLTEAAKEEAVAQMLELNAIADKEDATETLLEAKGFSDAFVRITEDNVDVVVNAESLTEQEVAQITDIVTRKTGMDVKDIVIAPVVVTE